MADRLVAVDDSNYLLPQPVRDAYLADVQNRIVTATSNLSGVAQAVADKIAPLTADGQVSPLLDTATATRVKLDARYGIGNGTAIIAPAPSGGDDTAVLQSLLNTVQTSGGTLVLRAGTYRANLTTASSFFQPNIVGQGVQHTFLKSYTSGGDVLTMVGKSGSVTGAWVRDFCVQGSSTSRVGNGIVLAGCGGVNVQVQFRDLATGLLFYNRDTGMYTEFCVAHNCVWDNVTAPVIYRVGNGDGSFHGTGIDGGVIFAAAGGPCITIEANAFPYNAPLTVAAFAHFPNSAVIVNNSGGRIASFYGTITLELQNASGTIFAAETAYNVILVGGVSVLGAVARLGNLYLADKVYYTGGNTYVQLKPYQRTVTLAAGTVPIGTGDVFIQNASAFLINTWITGPNGYQYAHQLLCWQNPFNDAGVVTVLATPMASAGTSGVSAPTYTWSNYGLNITNAGYSSSYTVRFSVTSLGGQSDTDQLGQF